LFAEKLLNSSGREFRRALFSLKQIFQVFMCVSSQSRDQQRTGHVTTFSAWSSSQLCTSEPVFLMHYALWTDSSSLT